LSAFHAAIIKKAGIENLPFGKAAYALMDGIDTSSKLADMKGHLEAHTDGESSFGAPKGCYYRINEIATIWRQRRSNFKDLQIH